MLWQATTLAQLLKGRQNLKNEFTERTGQLKALVKENFDRFISCKNTIDDIHKRLRKSEAHDSLAASGNSTADMVVAISEVPAPWLPLTYVIVHKLCWMSVQGFAFHRHRDLQSACPGPRLCCVITERRQACIPLCLCLLVLEVS